MNQQFMHKIQANSGQIRPNQVSMGDLWAGRACPWAGRMSLTIRGHAHGRALGLTPGPWATYVNV
jgi:hypothetical protein